MVMKNNYLFLVLTVSVFISCFSGLNGQNLVPNPSFESFVICPSLPDQLSNTDDWYSPSLGTPDYFNVCANGTDVAVPSNIYGSQDAATGSGYAGIKVYSEGNEREYLSNEFTQPLELGETYCFEMKVSLADNFIYGFFGIQDIGLSLSTQMDDFTTNGIIPANIQYVNMDGIIGQEEDWVLLSGTFVANAAYSNLTIGNFYSNQNTLGGGADPGTTDTLDTYYFIDDVSLRQVPSNVLGAIDSLSYCTGQTVSLSANNIPDATFMWYPMGDPETILSTDGDFEFEIIETTTFIVEATIGSCVVTDTIYIEATEIPQVNFTYANACVGGTAQLIDLSTNVMPGAIYEWDVNNDGTIDATTSGVAEYVFTEPGIFLVSLTVSNNDICFSELVDQILVDPICDPCLDPFNFVPNPNLESFTECPTDLLGLSGITDWFQPTDGTTDFFHPCFEPINEFNSLDVPDNTFGSQEPLSGNGYLGFFAYRSLEEYREYASIGLEEPLEQGKAYCVSFNVSLSDFSAFAVEDLGAYLSADSISGQGELPLNFTPQIVNPNGVISDKTDWVSISDVFIADTNASWITIGNFSSDANSNIFALPANPTNIASSYYYLDDVSITEMPILEIPDTSICEGEFLMFDAPTGFCDYQWYFADDPDNIVSVNESFNWLPSTPGNYQIVLEVNKEACLIQEVINVNVVAKPEAIFSVASSCFQDVVAFVDLSEGIDPGATYEWDFDNDEIIDATDAGSVGHYYPAAGIYVATLTITNPGGCSSFSAQTVLVDAICDPCDPANIIFNPGFEFYDGCPSDLDQIEMASDWYSPTENTADYYNACSDNGVTGIPNNAYGNSVLPFQGDAYAGIVAYVNGSAYNTFMATRLSAPLIVGEQYCVGFKVHLAPESGFAIDNIGINFSVDEVDPDNDDLEPQIGNQSFEIIETDGWREISSIFVADQPYAYLTLGNFYEISDFELNANNIGAGDTAYYYIDDVAIAPVQLELTGPNTICLGDNITLVAEGNLCTHAWMIAGSNEVLGNEMELNITPDSTTTFMYVGGNDACDSISMEYTVTVIDVPNLGEDLVLCKGDTLQLNDQTGGAISYQWTPEEGLSDPNIANPLAFPDVTTTYVLEVEYTFATNCGTRDTITISVADQIANAGSDVSICQGEEAQLLATGGDIYQWSPAGGLSSTIVDNPVADPNQTTQYVVTVTNSVTGCSDTDTLMVFVSPCDLGGPQWVDSNGLPISEYCQETFLNQQLIFDMPGIIDPDIQAGLDDFILITDVQGPSNGEVQVSLNEVIYTPDLGYQGPDEVIVIACDTSTIVQCDTLLLCLTVQGEPNTAPIIQSDSICLPTTVNTDIAYCFEVTDDSDLYEDFDISILVDSVFFGDGLFVNDDNCLVYVGDPNYTGDVDFAIIEICDTEGLCDTIFINYLVFPENFPPEVSQGPVSVPQNGSTDFCLTINDNNASASFGEFTTLSVLDGPDSGSIELLTDTCLMYTANLGAIGTDEVTLVVCDDGKDITTNYDGPCDIEDVQVDNPLCDTITVQINIIDGLNVIDDYTIIEDGAACAFNLFANDTPGQMDSAYVVSGPFFGTINTGNIENGIISYQATIGFTGIDSLVYAACVDGIGCETAVWTIEIVDQLQANNDSVTIYNLGADTIFILNNDEFPSQGNVNVQLIDPVNNGFIELLEDGSIVYTPFDNYFGPDEFTYSIFNPDNTCGNVNGSAATVFITVEEALPPIANNDIYNAGPLDPVIFDVTENDINPLEGELDIYEYTNPENGTIFIEDGMIVYQANTGYLGVDMFEYIICNAAGLCDTALVSIRITVDCELEIMGGISPNNDNSNDVFRIIPLAECRDFAQNEITIFNRWGSVVYNQFEYGNDGTWWDGTWQNNGEQLPVGTYFYVIEITNPETSAVDVIKGSVEVFR